MPQTICQWYGMSGVLNGSLVVHHTTVITWVKLVGELLPDAYDPAVVPTVGEQG